ncbi:pre-mrna splicing factor rna helicase [Fusarium tjaetaba]|uniref:RNA helicase n=1 Tax=Fusarium tjaetaba TaxID=1567544 RepID=A0A8H5VSC6_9HYPO|nr:pre-mrna splicing factor rna helicase [Fusarium tjaetaba]KAF5631489.1 pre-mrna splicing factor rna helicase [Fusarium tjaetaba]
MDDETTEEVMYMTVLGCELAKPNPLRPGVNRSPSYFETLKQYCHLPIMQKEGFNRFLQLYMDSQVTTTTTTNILPLLRFVTDQVQVVVVNPESSADSIQLTKRVMYLELFKDLQVLCTQPDNVATRELGQRVAAELDVTYGEQVGVQYRKYNKTSDKTLLRFVTEGMLLQIIGDNPTMAGYSCLVLDFYEPTSNVDRLLPLLKKAIGLRYDLQVVIMSTKYFEKFALYFDVPHGLTIGGSSFPVGVQHVIEAVADYCETACHTVNQIHQDQSPGDILVFLATDIHVDRVVAQLRGAIPDMETLPLYGKLSKAEKAKALRSRDKSRCVITTNFAESSNTVEGIVYVVGKSIAILIGGDKLMFAVDCGFEMQSVYNPRVRIATIQPWPISKPSADLRTACAGGGRPGLCYRLYTREMYDALHETSYTSSLKDCVPAAILALKSAGINSIGTFNFLDPASEEVYLRGITDVNAMNLIDEVGIITPAGKVAATLPIDLTWYNAFNEAIKLGCLSELIDIAALASVKNPIFLRPHETQHAADLPHGQFTAPLSDHMTELNTLRAYLRTKRSMSTQELATWCNETFLSSEALEEALVLQKDLIKWCKAKLDVSEISVLTPNDKDYDVKIRKAIAKGFFLHAAMRDDSPRPDQYRTLKEGYHVWIHPNSALGGGDWEWVVYHKIEPTGFQYMDRCTVIEPTWLLVSFIFWI